MNRFPNDRMVTKALAERLRVMPAVVVTGSRQTGKSTLVQELTPGKRSYYSLDDLDVLHAAKKNPEALVGGKGAVTIDEIQRAPELLHAIKREIDRNRTAGRFLLTGSANLLLLKSVSESLAGRASYLTLWPMTRSEALGDGRAGHWEQLVGSNDEDWLDVLNGAPIRDDWKGLVRRGGYPTPVLEIQKSSDRSIWFDGYVRTYLERDLHDIAAISDLVDYRRLMVASAHRLGQMINQTELSRDISVPQATVHRWLNIMETSYMLVRLPAYSVNKTKRLMKTPKLYWSDTALALHLANNTEPGGAHLENFILHDLMVWRDARIGRPELFYWRTQTNEEVDLVVEVDGKLIPIEVKSTTRPRLSDATHLLSFQAEYGKRSRAGLLIHTGSQMGWLTPTVLAVPWWRVV
ncbi:MAG TPA: ATP-binding protein [Chlorobiota bacterium]|nr:ATP-binding protein [Chlorobiota bacterium]